MRTIPVSTPRYQPNSLFQKGPNVHLNACIGSNGGPYDYGTFSDGYFTAADHLVLALANGEGGEILIDSAVYPIVSNYRHGLELGLKHCIILASRLLDRTDNLQLSHDLNGLWSQFLPLADGFEDLLSRSDRRHLSEVIRDFVKTDPVGMVFRYPEDKQRNLQIDSFELLNLEVLRNAMFRCHEIFKDVSVELEERAGDAGISGYSVARGN